MTPIEPKHILAALICERCGYCKWGDYSKVAKLYVSTKIQEVIDEFFALRAEAARRETPIMDKHENILADRLSDARLGGSLYISYALENACTAILGGVHHRDVACEWRNQLRAANPIKPVKPARRERELKKLEEWNQRWEQ